MHIVAVTGSLRVASSNTGLLRVCKKYLETKGHSCDIFVPDLPLFNQDLETSPGDLVLAWQERCAKADAFIFATCEYNYSISGALKNAIDWASRGPAGTEQYIMAYLLSIVMPPSFFSAGNLFNDKAAAVVSAGGGVGGLRAQMHLRDIALFLNLHIMNAPTVQLNIFAPPGTQVDLATGDISHKETILQLEKVVDALIVWTGRIGMK